MNVWVSPDGSRVATLNRRQVVVWDPALGEATHKFDPEGVKHCTGWAGDAAGRVLVTAGQANVRFWDTATWQERAAYDWKIGPVTAVALSQDGMVAAAGSKSGKIVLWDVDG
jgi:WD40 repeat protein